MNRTDVMNLLEGREIEGLIAVHLFNFQKVPWSGNKEQEVFVWRPEQAHTIDWWGKDVMYLVPCYSTTLDEAWEIVERMRHTDWKFRMCSRDNGYQVWFEKKIQRIQRPEDERPDLVFHALAETASLAICRAALMAVLELA